MSYSDPECLQAYIGRKECKAIKEGPFMQQDILLRFGDIVTEQNARR